MNKGLKEKQEGYIIINIINSIGIIDFMSAELDQLKYLLLIKDHRQCY